MEGVVILFSDDGDFDVVDIFYEEDVKSFIVRDFCCRDVKFVILCRLLVDVRFLIVDYKI